MIKDIKNPLILFFVFLLFLSFPLVGLIPFGRAIASPPPGDPRLRGLLSGGGLFSVAVGENREIVSWGVINPFGGAMVPPPQDPRGIMVSGGFFHVLSLRSDGTVVAWGNNNSGQCDVPAGLSNVVAVSAGANHSLALRSDGTVVAWGDNSKGQCNVPSGLSGVVAIAAGKEHSLALKSDGAVVAWGDNTYGQCTVPSGLSHVVAVAAGGYHSLALKSDGAVVAWGDNTYGQCTVPSGLSHVVAIAAGGYHSLALRSDGTVVAWGNNDYGQCDVPEGLADVIMVAAGFSHSLVARSDGTVVAWGWNITGQCNVPEGFRVFLPPDEEQGGPSSGEQEGHVAGSEGQTVVTLGVLPTLLTFLEPEETFGTIPTGVVSDLLDNVAPSWGPGVLCGDGRFLQTEKIDYNVGGNVVFGVEVYPQNDFYSQQGDRIAITNLSIERHPSAGSGYVQFSGIGERVQVATGQDPRNSESGIDFGFDLKISLPDNTPPYRAYSTVLVFVAYQQ